MQAIEASKTRQGAGRPARNGLSKLLTSTPESPRIIQTLVLETTITAGILTKRTQFGATRLSKAKLIDGSSATLRRTEDEAQQ